MEELTAGVEAAKAYLAPHIEALPFWQRAAARSFVSDETLREFVAAILDATHLVQTAANTDPVVPPPKETYDV